VIFKSLLCVSDEGISPTGDEQRYLNSVQVAVKILVIFMFAFDHLDRSFHDSGMKYLCNFQVIPLNARESEHFNRSLFHLSWTLQQF
jgi:hypothetical protein